MSEKEKEYHLLIKNVKSIESKLIPIKAHLRGMTDYFLIKDPYEPGGIYNWFWMASSINSVNFDGIKYDCAFSMCRPAYEYEIEKQKLYTNLINEITRFLYVYSGFESLINEMKLIECPSYKGKINSVKYYLKSNYSSNFNSIPYYEKLLGILRVLVRNSSLNQYEQDFSLDDCTDINGMGLKIIYKIRNQLAHGNYKFPEPADWSFSLPLEPEITQISSRLIILATQMIMTSLNKDNFMNLEFHDSEILPTDDYGSSEINELDFLTNFHVASKYSDNSQLELFNT